MISPRMLQYQQEARTRGASPPDSPKEANMTRAFFELYADLPLPERQARTLVFALENEPVRLHPRTRIVGQIYQRCLGAGAPEVSGSQLDPRWNDFAVSPVAAKRVRDRLPENAWYGTYFSDGAAPGHVCWDWGLMLSLGARGMIEQHQAAAAATDDDEAKQFHQCVAIVLEGLCAWGRRHAEAARAAAAEENDPEREAELEAMAAACERVPEHPARTFCEAAQSFYLQHLAVMFENPFGGNGPGRMDYYLWPYLEADLAAGTTTMDEARELMAELLIKLHERIQTGDGWVEAVPVGGRHADGSLAINPLSYMILEQITELKQTHPSVYVRLPNDAPDDFVALAAKNLIDSENRGQIYADDPMIEALHADGVALEDARHWTAGGCMEVSAQGCQGDLLFAFAHNAARTLELVLTGGELLQSGERIIDFDQSLADFDSYDELLQAFRAEFHRELGILMKRLDLYLEAYAEFRPSFLLSSMTHDCLERGRAINDGGARYADYGGSAVGLPNVGDSLYAIKRAVFEDRQVTGGELLQALRDSFAGRESLRAYLRALPKFGQDVPEVDAVVDDVLRMYTEFIKAHRTPHGGHCRPIILGFVWVVSMGKQTGAMADGRLAGEPLAHSLAPTSGNATKGLTAGLKSYTRLSLKECGGGGSSMWDLDPQWATPELIASVLRTFTQLGGHIFQGNVIDVSQLLAAQKNPERHADLMVRVGGYSARFTTLSKDTQDELIARHKFAG